MGLDIGDFSLQWVFLLLMKGFRCVLVIAASFQNELHLPVFSLLPPCLMGFKKAKVSGRL